MLKRNKLILFFLFINFLFSVFVAQAQISINGEMEVGPCTTNCVRLNVPVSLSPTANAPVFIDNSKKLVYLLSTNSGQYLEVVNSIDSSVAPPVNFSVQVSASDLSDSVNNLPISEIGILTYNETPGQTVDGRNSSGGDFPVSRLNPRNIIADPPIFPLLPDPFNESALNNRISSGEIGENYFQFFDSGPHTIMETPVAGNYLGSYNIGFAVVLRFPEFSIDTYNLRDGNYMSPLTFTLTVS